LADPARASRASTERFIPSEAESPDELAIALLHLYAYETAAKLIQAGDRVLDVGFGEGYGADILTRSGAEYLGVELDAGMVSHARERYGLAFDTYDGKSIPAGEGTFDVVVSFQVIEHVPEPSPWLAEIRRVLKPGGTAIFTTPNRVYRLGGGERPWNRHHVQEFTAEELRELLARVFSDVRVYGVRGSEEIESIVHARAARARKLARIDRLGLRYHLPEGLDTRIRRALRRAAQPEVEPGVFALDALWQAEPADDGLDLLAITHS
jgi:2-polyprenyl-3-methyl-5-hydroxy-6-metoxy-1,4-benzoquinol methylase